MRKIASIVLALLVFGSLAARAEVKEASDVYKEFSQWSSVIKSADPQSPEYNQAKQEMLQLYPLLHYHAATYSQNRQMGNAMAFAKAYVDLAWMPQFADMHLEQSEPYATMTYFLASNYYNRKDYTNAITYLKRYIELGEPKNRAVVFLFLAKCYENVGDYDSQVATLESALHEYPTTSDLLAMSINIRMAKGLYEEALPYVERALLVKPADTKLVSLKGQCLEGMKHYAEAADVYAGLAEQQKTLNTYKHYALNLYNCAVQNYETDKNYAVSYFHRAIPILQQVVANDPTSVLYTNALAMAYLYTDNYEDLAAINVRLKVLGAPEVNGVMSAKQELLTSDIPTHTTAPAAQPVAQAAPAYKEPQPAAQKPAAPQPQEQVQPKKQSEYATFVQNYVEKELHTWQQKDPFETIDEYKERVTEQTRNAKAEELMKEAKRRFLAKHEKKIRPSDFELMPYDAENKVFLLRSSYGDVVLPVPRENNEARSFAASWKEVLISNPIFDVAGDEVVIRSIDFVTPKGNVYNYTNNDNATYTQTEIAMQFDQIDYSQLGGGAGSAKKNNVKIEKNNVVVGNSDVDINIPVAKSVHANTFAFLIGNEHYQQVSAVPFALHDVQIMKQYCNKTLGIPETNIRMYEDATFGKFLSCMREIRSIADAYNGNIDIIFYYAGHGVPDESSKSAYLLPVDADATQTETCFPVGRLYHELGQLGAKSVVVFMDACFSGSQRGEGMLASARGVALKAKPDAPQGRMVTLSAATGDETAYPYDEQQHGMFTYYVLKALQDSKGRTSLGDLADYVQTQVKQRSVVINHKSQTPTVNASEEASDWRKWNWK